MKLLDLVDRTSAEDTRRIREAAAERELYARWTEAKQHKQCQRRTADLVAAALVLCFLVLAAVWGL